MRLNGTPVIHTARLLLRRYCAADAQAAFSLWARGSWDDKLTGFSPHDSVEDTKRLLHEWIAAYESPNMLRWAICDENGWIGDIAVTRWQPGHHSGELAFSLAAGARHRGYMQEALQAVVRYLMESVGFHRIVLNILSKNTASSRLAERAGFRLEGTLRDAFRHSDGSYSDILVYARVSPSNRRDAHQILKEN